MKLFMRLSFKIFLLVVFTLSQLLLAQNKYVIGAGGNYNLPVGSLADRMKGNIGGWLYAGKQVSDNWTWVGKFEYFKLDEVNEDQMYKIVETNVNGSTQQLRFPLARN